MVGGEGSVVDLSIRGCRIESSTDVQPGAALEVQIGTSAQELPILIQVAVVRWSRGREFGLEFEVVSPTEWTHLQELVKVIELEPYEEDNQTAKPKEPS
jgi:PilZ domain